MRELDIFNFVIGDFWVTGAGDVGGLYVKSVLFTLIESETDAFGDIIFFSDVQATFTGCSGDSERSDFCVSVAIGADCSSVTVLDSV